MPKITIFEMQILQAATFYAPCPHCGVYFASSVSGLMECGFCKGLIDFRVDGADKVMSN